MNSWIYIALMAVTTIAIRMLPLTLIRKPLKSKFIRSFLYYVPYVTLAAMTFPSIMNETSHFSFGLTALVLGGISAYKGLDMFKTTLICCISVVILEFIF